MRDWYFQPRPFELRHKGKIYVQLGVRIFKKWVPTSGEVITRHRGIDRLKIAAPGGRRKALENYVKQTRKWEGRHLISAIILVLWSIIGGIYIGIEQFYVSTVINVLVNLYPIIVQRYNRARITLIQKHMG